MVAYLAAGRSAAANDDSLESALKNGLSGMAAVTAMQSFLSKLTLVAEVDDRVAFGKGLDTMIIAINNELEAQAKEKEEEEERKTPDAEKGAAPAGEEESVREEEATHQAATRAGAAVHSDTRPD